MKTRYQVGLEKLLAAEADVTVMKTELIELQPKLVETGKEVEETLKVCGGGGVGWDGVKNGRGAESGRREGEGGGQNSQTAPRVGALPLPDDYP